MDNIDIKELLEKPVKNLSSVGPAREKGFNSLGLFTFKDILYYFPRRYEDRKIFELDKIELHATYAVRLKIAAKPSAAYIKGGVLPMLKFKATEVTADEFGIFSDNLKNTVNITFFHSDYLRSVFKVGEIYIFYGRITGNLVEFDMVNPKFISLKQDLETPRFYPVYKKNSKITQNIILKAVDSVLNLIGDKENGLEIFPEHILKKYKLCTLGEALRHIHKPRTAEELESAKRRLVFEEFFLYSLALEIIKDRRGEIPGYKYGHDIDMRGFYDVLPFALTGAQRRAISEALDDMRKGTPMSRLVQGDVGSGKTVIAAAAAYYACKNKTQAVMMAPTDILANQHFDSLSELFSAFDMRVCLLTGNLGAARKRETLKLIESGEADFIIGTHAVIQKGVKFKNLSLAITDEQHRFGVNQRALISGKLDEQEIYPHALVMSATPIPRTLALIMYGDLDVSVVNESPPGRQKVDTFAVDGTYRERIYNFTRKLIGEGGQVYIVCPLVGEDEQPDGGNISDMKSVKSYYKELSENIFPDISSGFVHGRLKASEKDEIMEKFRLGDIKILVSTVVIEVGVNVPNAVLMIIENAERFGLSQLHQLRGRVGRGEKKSYCVLFSENGSDKSNQRLDIMTKTNDGFEIAKKDIEIRGPGDLFGEKQSGTVKFKIADLAENADILYEASKAAKEFAEKAKTGTGDKDKLNNKEGKICADLIETAARMFEDGEIAFN